MMRNSLASTLLRLVRERAQGASLKTLRKEGVEKVTVLDAAKLQELVEQAVQQTLLKRGIELGDGERDAFLAEAAEKVKDLMHERDSYKERTQSLTEEKHNLAERLAQEEQTQESLKHEIEHRDQTLQAERQSHTESLQKERQVFEAKISEVTEALDHERIKLASQIDVLKRDLESTRDELVSQRASQADRQEREIELEQQVELLAKSNAENAAATAQSASSPLAEATDSTPVADEEADYLSDPATDLPQRLREAILELIQARADRQDTQLSEEFLGDMNSLADGIVNISVGILNDLRRHALSQARSAQKKRIENLERRLDKLKGNLVTAEGLLEAAQSQPLDDSGVPSMYRSAQGLKGDEQGYESKKKLLEEVFNQNVLLRGLIQEGGASDT